MKDLLCLLKPPSFFHSKMVSCPKYFTVLWVADFVFTDQILMKDVTRTEGPCAYVAALCQGRWPFSVWVRTQRLIMPYFPKEMSPRQCCLSTFIHTLRFVCLWRRSCAYKMSCYSLIEQWEKKQEPLPLGNSPTTPQGRLARCTYCLGY